MTSYVEAHPGDAGRAANHLQLTNTSMQTGDAPPDPATIRFGDDEFGEHMRSVYLASVDDGPCLPDRCVEEKHKIGGRCGELGDGVHQAMRNFELQEMVNTHLLAETSDESEDSGSGGSSGGGGNSGGGGSSGGGTPPATPAPPATPVVTGQDQPAGGTSTSGGQQAIRMVRTLKWPDDQEEPAEDSAPGLMVAGRMFRALVAPGEQDPESPSPDQEDQDGQEAPEDPERRAFMTRLMRFSDPSDVTPDESTSEGESTPESGNEPGRIYRANWRIHPDDDTAPEPTADPDSDAGPHPIHRAARWLIDPTDHATPPESESERDGDTNNGRIYRARWMVNPDDKSAPQE